MLKHYIEKHKEIKVEEMKFSVKILKSYRSAFERQIGESVFIEGWVCTEYLRSGFANFVRPMGASQMKTTTSGLSRILEIFLTLYDGKRFLAHDVKNFRYLGFLKF